MAQEENQTSNNANTSGNANNSKARRQRGKKQQQRNQKNRTHKEAAKNQQGKKGDKSDNKKKNHQRHRRRNPRPWRKHIPRGTVDPITLEELSSLSYPPFALCAAGPYLPVPEWPPQQTEPKQQQQTSEPQEDPKQRERKLLQEQWGASALPPQEGEEDSKPTARPTDHRSFNLFDGRALAYYMVSQQQFIDPLNRRDLARDELVHLDRYLARHGFDANVVEAYDTKGISLSMAGAASTTAAGRAQILQEEAQLLLNALFVRPSNSLAQQYNRYQQEQDPQPSRPNNSTAGTSSSSSESEESDEDGWGNTIYGNENDGMMVIDDDENPSMRGGDAAAVARRTTTNTPTPELFPALVTSSDSEQPKATQKPTNLWVGHNIIGAANQTSNLKDRNFPLLAPATTTNNNARKGAASKSKKAAGAQQRRQQKLLEEQWGNAAAVLRRPTAASSSSVRPNDSSMKKQNFPLIPLTKAW